MIRHPPGDGTLKSEDVRVDRNHASLSYVVAPGMASINAVGGWRGRMSFRCAPCQRGVAASAGFFD